MFFPRSECLPRSKRPWLQSPPTVTFEAQANKVCHCFFCLPVYLPWSDEVMGPDAMILVFWMLSFKPGFSLSSFTVIKRLFSSSSLSVLTLKEAQLCPTLCDPVDYSPPGSSVTGILQAKVLELPFPSPINIAYVYQVIQSSSNPKREVLSASPSYRRGQASMRRLNIQRLIDRGRAVGI